jgi:hypothetical protein
MLEPTLDENETHALVVALELGSLVLASFRGQEGAVITAVLARLGGVQRVSTSPSISILGPRPGCGRGRSWAARNITVSGRSNTADGTFGNVAAQNRNLGLYREWHYGSTGISWHVCPILLNRGSIWQLDIRQGQYRDRFI